MPGMAERPVLAVTEEEEEPRRMPKIGMTVAGLAVALFAGAVWYIYDRGVTRGELRPPPIIAADPNPAKQAPADPGGAKIPNQGIEVIARAANRPGAKVEQLLPPPERPLAEQPRAELPPRPEPAAAPAEGGQGAEAPAAGAESGPSVVEVAPRAVPPPAAPPQPPVASEPARPENAAKAAAPVPVQPAPVETAAVAAAKPAPAEQVAAIAPSVGGGAGGFRVQLASVADAAAADREWLRLSRANPDLLGRLKPSVTTVDLPGKGTFHRLSVGPFGDRAAAVQACEALKQRKVGCFVVAP